MTTRETIEAYFDGLESGRGWQELLSEGMEFTSFASPVRSIAGREAFLEATKRFYSMIDSVQLRELIVADDRGCALTRYELRAPDGRAFGSDVAEIFSVRGGRIVSFGIYFDTAPYPPRPVQPEKRTAESEGVTRTT